MRTIRIKLYKFSELSKESQATALENYANHTEYFWGHDAIKSLEKFAAHFDCELKNYSIDWLNSAYSHIHFEIPDHVHEWSEDDLLHAIDTMGSYDKDTLKGEGDCKFTGVCFDEDAADGARISFFKDGERDIKEILLAGFNSWHKSVTSDFEYQLSAEGYEEHCDANDIEFTKDGEIH